MAKGWWSDLVDAKTAMKEVSEGGQGSRERLLSACQAIDRSLALLNRSGGPRLLGPGSAAAPIPRLLPGNFRDHLIFAAEFLEDA